MSKQETLAESNTDVQTDEEVSDCLAMLQTEDNANCTQRTSSSDRSLLNLLDLPVELLECILVEVVVMEVKDMKMAKSEWKRMSSAVISRLEEVCLKWSSVLMSSFFQNKVNKILDQTAQETSRLEILLQSPIQFEVSKVTTTKDEIFLLCDDDDDDEGDQDRVINVYDRNNLTEIKDVITLPGIRSAMIAGCCISNCVYVGSSEFSGLSVLRITKDEEQQFNMSPWLSEKTLSFVQMSVSVLGNVIIISNRKYMDPALVSIYNVNGTLQRKVRLLPGTYGFKYLDSIIQKPNGNLIVVCANHQVKTKLMEINTMGRLLRQYQSSLNGQFGIRLADVCGRILIAHSHEKMELLDCEFNLMEFAVPELAEGQVIDPYLLCFNSARNEIVTIVTDDEFENGVLTIFRLI